MVTRVYSRLDTGLQQSVVHESALETLKILVLGVEKTTYHKKIAHALRRRELPGVQYVKRHARKEYYRLAELFFRRVGNQIIFTRPTTTDSQAQPH